MCGDLLSAWVCAVHCIICSLRLSLPFSEGIWRLLSGCTESTGSWWAVKVNTRIAKKILEIWRGAGRSSHFTCLHVKRWDSEPPRVNKGINNQGESKLFRFLKSLQYRWKLVVTKCQRLGSHKKEDRELNQTTIRLSCWFLRRPWPIWRWFAILIPIRILYKFY